MAFLTSNFLKYSKKRFDKAFLKDYDLGIMKIFLILGLSFFLLSCEKIRSLPLVKTLLEEPAPPVETEEDKMSYVLGYLMSDHIKKTNTMLNTQVFVQGVKDNMENKQPLLSMEDIKSINDQITQKAQLKKQAETNERNQMEGQKFLENNKSKKTVKVTESGLQYEILSEGKKEAKKPSLTDKVEVHYKGTLIDGTEFDSSYKREQTAVFPLGNVIKGWQEGLQLMSEGSKYKFYVPYDLAYGESGAGDSIPPYSTLIFEIELIKVQ